MRRTFALVASLSFLATLAPMASAADGDDAECRLRGRVVDNFGEPQSGVDVGVEDRVVAVTGEDGSYDAECQPGRLALWFRKAGLAPEAFVADIGGPNAPPSARIELARVPPGPGVWLRGDGQYVHVPQVQLEIVDVPRADGGVDRQYHVPAGLTLPRVKGQDVRIVDAEPRPLALLQADGDLVATETYLAGDWSTPVRLGLRGVAERSRQVADLSLRNVPAAGDRVACLVGTACMKGRRALATEGASAPAWCFAMNDAPLLDAAHGDGAMHDARVTLGVLREAARAVEHAVAGGRLEPTEGVVPLAGVVPDAPATLDAWGRDLVVQVDEDGRWAVGSAGADAVAPDSLTEGAPSPLILRNRAVLGRATAADQLRRAR